MADTMPQEQIREREQVDEQEAGGTTQHAAWWLSTRRRRSEWQSLMATGAATFSGRPRAHFEDARPGDPVLIYVSKPDHAIRAVGIVTGTNDGRRTTDDDKSANQHSELEVQLAFEVTSPLSWRDIV